METHRKSTHNDHLALWRICRVVANEVRLGILWALLRNSEMCVEETARCIGMSVPNTSIQLKTLHGSGLVVYRREGMQVIYSAKANASVKFAEDLLHALYVCHEQGTGFKSIIKQATAFTNERRIEVVYLLAESGRSFGQLFRDTGMSMSALARHLDKLHSRGVIKRTGRMYHLIEPQDHLKRTLLRLALS